MYPNIKPLIALSNINALPDGHLHSKVSFLKSIINEQQNPQIKQMKQRMYKMSYTVKNIGIHGQEIGITSKRMPLKQKDDYKPSEITSQKQKQVYRIKYLPHNTFYSQALIPLRKQTTQNQEQKTSQANPFLVTTANLSQNQFSQTNHVSPDTKFAKKSQKSNKFGKNFSHASKFKATFNKQSNQKQEEFIQKVTTIRRTQSEQQGVRINKFSHKKSFAKMLNQVGNKNKQIEVVPLYHEENPMFKKIKKLQELSLLNKDQISRIKFTSHRELERTSSTLAGRYQTMMSTSRNFRSRRTLSKLQ